MATDAAILMAVAIVSMLLPLVVIKFMVKRITQHRRGDTIATRNDEAARLFIVSCTTIAMGAAVFFLGPEHVAPHMMPASEVTVATADGLVHPNDSAEIGAVLPALVIAAR